MSFRWHISELIPHTGPMCLVDEVLEAQGTASDVAGLREPWLAPTDDGRHRIGYVEQIELEFPIIHAARRRGRG